MAPVVVLRRRLYKAWHEAGITLNNIGVLINFVQNIGQCESRAVKLFAYTLLKKWKTVHRVQKVFESKHASWLDGFENFFPNSKPSK